MHQTIKLTGLTCPACKKVTEKRISTLEGVNEVQVSVEDQLAHINADREISILEINTVFKDTPYQAIE